MSKKGLFIFYCPSPQHLLQFIWYYSTYGYDKKWDVLCLPNGVSDQGVKKQCENAGIFENVYYNEIYYLKASLVKRFSDFSKMLAYSCVGKREKYINKFLSEYVDLSHYDEVNVLSDFGIVSGAFINLSNNKRVVIMEDGIADYNPRTYKNIYKKPFNIINVEGFIVSKLGYANVAYFYPLKAEKNCIKFSSRPDMMKYLDYKEINRLYDFSKTDMALYNKIIKNAYTAAIDCVPFESAEAILFTTPISDYTESTEKYIKLLEKYVVDNYRSIIIKKHPRDKADYCFDGVECQYVPQAIPSETLFPYLKNKELIFADSSSLLLNIEPESDVKCLYFNDMSAESAAGGTYEKYPDFEKFKIALDFFGLKKLNIMKI